MYRKPELFEPDRDWKPTFGAVCGRYVSCAGLAWLPTLPLRKLYTFWLTSLVVKFWWLATLYMFACSSRLNRSVKRIPFCKRMSSTIARGTWYVLMPISGM